MAAKGRLSEMAKELAQAEPEQPYTSKIKSTHNLSPKVLASLEIGQSKLRTMIDPKLRGKLNRSLLVELAVKSAMADFVANGTKSRIYRDTENHFTVNTE
jgi:hypothetical protein